MEANMSDEPDSEAESNQLRFLNSVPAMDEAFGTEAGEALATAGVHIYEGEHAEAADHLRDVIEYLEGDR